MCVVWVDFYKCSWCYRRIILTRFSMISDVYGPWFFPSGDRGPRSGLTSIFKKSFMQRHIRGVEEW